MNLTGLTKEEVKQRIRQGKVNYDTTTPSKSVKQILLENTCTLFNFINLVLGIAIIVVGSYKNLLFLGVVVCNTLISTIQEIRAKKIVDKLSVISSSKAKVIRDSKMCEIHINDIVLDDLIIYELGNQVVVDSKVVDGVCEVNESFITGESKTIYKKKGDEILSGSFVVSGNVKAKVIHVGLDNYTSVISRDAKKLKKEINSEIMRSLNKIVKYVSIALIPIGILLLLKQLSIPDNTTQNAVVTVVAAVVGMIPEGLILLVSTVLAISVLKLSKYNVLVQDLYAIETLARVDTLCLDKTGTITEGKMEVSDIIPLNNNKISDIDYAMEVLSTNLNDKNPTFLAINDKYKNNSNEKAIKTIPFSSERKYSGIILKDCSYIMGAPEFVLEDDLKTYEKEIEKYFGEYKLIIVNTLALWRIITRLECINKKIIWWLHEEESAYEILKPDFSKIKIYNNLKIYGVGAKAIDAFKKFCPQDITIDSFRWGIENKYSDTKFDYSNGKLVFAIIGPDSYIKGQDFLIDTLKNCSRDILNNIEILLIGDISESKKEIYEKVPAVKCLGIMTHTELMDMYERIGVILSVSRNDTFPVVLIEAMMRRRVCMMSDVVGTAEFISNYRNGIIFKSENSNDLISSIEWCLNNRRKLNDIAYAGYETYQKYFSKDIFKLNACSIVEKYINK